MRLVSLCPSLTETVFALGRGGDLVGVTEWCVHPAPGVAVIEKVGGTKNPRIGRIVELEPDLVLMNAEENRFEDAEALTAAGVRWHSSLPRTPREVGEQVLALGGELGRIEAARVLARAIEERVEQLERRRQATAAQRFAYLIWRKPWMAVGRETYIDALLTLGGGVNVLGDRAERYPVTTGAELSAADPERVFLATEPLAFTEGHAEELAGESGLPRERFRIVDGELLSWHGARTPAGLDYASELFREGPEDPGWPGAKTPPASPSRSGSPQ